MTRAISVDNLNDIYIGPDGSLALSSNLIATMQACQQAAQTQLGEMVFAVDQGLPNFSTVWNGAPNLAQFEAHLRRAITEVEGVVAIQSLTVAVAGNALTYRATIQTIYGTGALNV